ncbi:hypothetical protein AMTRI_Chr09g17110 [Amborella trichopoda]
MARIMGKEAALFILSTKFQENFISDMVHCEISASEVILGDQSHIHLLENGGISKIGCAHSKTVSRNLDGTIDINLIEATIRDPAKAMCYPTTRRIFLENTQAKYNFVLLYNFPMNVWAGGECNVVIACSLNYCLGMPYLLDMSYIEVVIRLTRLIQMVFTIFYYHGLIGNHEYATSIELRPCHFH